MAISTRWSRSPVTRPDQSPSIMARPSSSRPSSAKNEIAPSSDSTTMPTLSIRCTGGRRRTRCSAFRVLLGSSRVELKADDGFVADDPRVVPGLNHVRLACAYFLFGSVIVDDVHGPRLQQTDVVGLAALAAHDRLDALRPSPARLQAHA